MWGSRGLQARSVTSMTQQPGKLTQSQGTLREGAPRARKGLSSSPRTCLGPIWHLAFGSEFAV